MAIHFKTETPKKLLATYKEAVDKGHVITWGYDKDGDFTHTAKQWNRKAWLRPRIVEQKELVFYILAPQGTPVSSEVYAIFHGRFVESLLVHCDGLFKEAVVSSMPENGDKVR